MMKCVFHKPCQLYLVSLWEKNILSDQFLWDFSLAEFERTGRISLFDSIAWQGRNNTVNYGWR